MSLRSATRNFQPSTEAAAPVDPDGFVSVIDNPFFTLRPGTTYVYRAPEGAEEAVFGTFTVTHDTIDILGVTCAIVQHNETVDGVLVERTKDYFAQDKDGNVHYFGEDVRNYEDGQFVGTEGTWRAGVDGAQPGIIMWANPEDQIGDPYAQENAPGVAEDMAEVISVDGLVPPADVPYGFFDHGLDTIEFSPLEPGVFEHKVYVPGVGLVAAAEASQNPDGTFDFGDVLEQLVRVRVNGTAADDQLPGYAGGDVINGHAGDDELSGLAGSDRLRGERGDDLLDGGDDPDADLLHGGKGDDLLRVNTADRAFGDKGSDALELLDNTDFGIVEGGDQHGHNLARIAGDILQFDGVLDLTAAGVSERISGIETLSMADEERDDGESVAGNLRDEEDGDTVTLSVQDVLHLGDGDFDPKLCGDDTFDFGPAIRVDGDSGDQLILAGGDWSEIEAKNAPDDYDVFASQVPDGYAFVLVQEDVAVDAFDLG